MSFLLCVHTETALKVEYHRTGSISLSYEIPQTLYFNEPHYVRLIHLGQHYLDYLCVGADFVKPSFVNGTLRPFIGVNNPDSLKPWIPLVNPNCLPQIGHFEVWCQTPTKGFSYREVTSNEADLVCIIVEFAGESLIKPYGA